MKLNVLFLHFLFNFIPTVTYAALCEDITGRWINKLGSELDIDHLQTGLLRGVYYTAVSSARGKLPGHDIVGTLPYNKPGSSFAFSVTWQNGSSTTVWTGQCLVCNGKETLETSWLLRSVVDSCIDKWKSTRVGKNVFERKPRTKRDIGDEPVKGPDKSIGHRCDLSGTWYNDVGSEVILNQAKSGVITGEYRTAVEQEKGSAGTTHSLVYGSSAFGNLNTTFSLIVVWRGGASVTGWVGQCHICENNTAVLEMSWLLRSKVDSCNDVWKSTMHGVNSFTHHEQKSGPRKSLGKHTPNRDGEDIGGGSATLMLSNTLLAVALFSFAFLVELAQS